MDVVGIGMPFTDFLISIESMPEPNGMQLLQEQSWQGGGKVATALVAAARLGASTGMIASVGADPYGKFCIDDFHFNNVDTSKLVIDQQGLTGFSVIISDNESQSRRIIGRLSTVSEPELNSALKEYIRSSRFLHLESPSTMPMEAAQFAKANGVKVVMDADFYMSGIEDMYPLIDVFIASEMFHDQVFQNDAYEVNCKRIFEQGPEIVLFTLGKRGCAGYTREGYFTLPSFEVDVQDTNGAGDVFHGAFIFGLLQGWDAKTTARFSSAVSAIKCTRIGGRAGIPDLKTAMRFLETGEIDYSDIDQRVEHYRKGEMLWLK